MATITDTFRIADGKGGSLMTTLREPFDFSTIFQTVSDAGSLELVQRVVQSEIVYHESRLTQLKQLDQAIGSRIANVSRG
jgi:hypothetical protein